MDRWLERTGVPGILVDTCTDTCLERAQNTDHHFDMALSGTRKCRFDIEHQYNPDNSYIII